MANKTIDQLDLNGTLTGSDTLELWQPSESIKSRKALLSSISEYVYEDNSESGTFTPELKFGGLDTGITYTNQRGFYCSDGKKCHFDIWITLTSKGTATGNASVTIPLPSLNTATYRSTNSITTTNLTWSSIPMFLILGNDSKLSIYTTASGSGLTQLTDAEFSNTTNLFISGTYLI